MNVTSHKEHQSKLARKYARRGAVAVEFAFVAPVLVAITMGMIELTRAFDVQNLLEAAAREGARFAAMDKDGLLNGGESSNSKLKDDVKSFMESNGINSEDVAVHIKDHADPGTDFDLDDPENELKLFEVHVSVDYSDVSYYPIPSDQDYRLTSKLIFRNGMATISD